MSSINFNELYKNNKNKYKYYIYFQKYLLIYNTLIFLLFLIFLIFLCFKLNHYKLTIIFIFIIIFIIFFLIDIYINRAKKCFTISDVIINNNNIKSIETKKHLLDKPFKEFYVNSSHNSYLPCNQNLDIVSLESIKKILLLGARSIELDIHSINNKPVIGHGTTKILTTTHLPLEDYIDVIVKYGFLTPDPLVLFIDVLTKNKFALKKTSEIIKLKLGERLLGKEFKINNENFYHKQFINEPIKNLLNKIIIVQTFGKYDFFNDILDDVTTSGRPASAIYPVNTIQTTTNLTTGISTEEIIKSYKINKIFTNILNSNNKKIDKYNNMMKRKYPYAGIWNHFSYNYDPVVHWKNKVNFVSLNFQILDDALIKNHIMFKDYSYVHFSEISFD